MWRRLPGPLKDLLLALAVTVLVLVPTVADAQPARPSAMPAAAATHQLALRREAQRVWGLAAPVATFAAQVHQESRWRADARSPVGALGMAQFMPATAAWISKLDAGLAANTPMNPTWALRALVVYDQWLHQRVRTSANACERMAFTLAAYNGGLGWVYKRQQQAPAKGVNPAVCLGAACDINPGITPASQRENAHYPRVILANEATYARWGPTSCSKA